MRRTFLLLVLTLFAAASLHAQTPPPAKPAPKPRPAARQPAAGKPATLLIAVTDPLGAPLGDTVVAATGPVDRGGTTAQDGTLRIQNMRAGAYRLRFEREGSITLEREVTIRGGESPRLDVTLTAAPAPPPEPEKPEPVVSPTLGPPGDPATTPIPLFLEKNFIGGREDHKESVLGCSATGTATLHQLRDAWASHTHEGADEWVYVVAGEGTLRLGTAEQRLRAGTFSLIPHSTTHALTPQGRNPLIVLSIVSGPACE